MTWFTKLRSIYATCLAILRYWSDVRDFVSAGAPAAGVNRLAERPDTAADLPPKVNVPCPEGTVLLFDGVVSMTIDGDTLDVQCTVIHRIRLIDCWCKETTLRMGTTPEEKAIGLDQKAFMESCLLKKTANHVRVFIPGHNGRLNEATTLSRLAARAWLIDPETHESRADTDLSGLMCRAGMATKTKEG